MITPHLVRGQALPHYQAGRRLVREALFRLALDELERDRSFTPVEYAALATQIASYLIGEDDEVARPILVLHHRDLVSQLAGNLMIGNDSARQAVIATLQLRELMPDRTSHPLRIRAEKQRAQQLLLAHEKGETPPSAGEYRAMAQSLYQESIATRLSSAVSA